MSIWFFAFSGLPFAVSGFSTESWYYSTSASAGLDLDFVHGLMTVKTAGVG